MERRTELLYYTAADREFFEPYANRDIEQDDFVAPLRRIVPASWSMQRSGQWMHCTPPRTDLPTQGWKIHVSSIPATARIVLSIAAATLVASGTAFKFAADARLLAAVNGKRWPRSGSGKFITVYPRDIADFRRIIEDLDEALSGYVGPYVLTDRRYRDSRVLYYRYGGIQSEFRVSAGGRREWLLRRPDGDLESDARQPCFRLPAWLRDPFPVEATATGPSSLHLGGGRYHVQRALTFSAAGGVYLADDRDEGRRVIIKEARPFIGGDAATATLRKEYRLLRRLSLLGVTPAPIAYFQDWEHHYLVEEYVEGTTLRHWLADRYPWLKNRATRSDVADFLTQVCMVFTHFAEALASVHAAGVSLGDLSFHNSIVSADLRVRLIDLEAAVEEGLDLPMDVQTPGFASSAPHRDDHAGACAEDVYAFGANLFAAIMPVNAMLPLDRHAASRFARHVCQDMGYPAAFIHAIGSLLANDPSERPSPVAVMATLSDASFTVSREAMPVPYRSSMPSSFDPSGDLFSYVSAMATRARPDRYVPAGPEVFETHPWGVAHGAAGVLHAYLRGGRVPPPDLRAYLLNGMARSTDRGTDLMHGDAGVAWVLFDAGEHEQAVCLLRDAAPDERIVGRAGLHEGLAGWGLARIKAWRETSDPSFLAAAVVAGNELVGRALGERDTLCWPLEDATQPVGLGHGASGIALFLLHLHIATNDARFLAAGRAGLAFDLAQSAFNPDGERTWPTAAGGVSLMPYLRHGTAGVLAVVARYLAWTGDAAYREIILASEADLLRRHAICPGLFDGLAGIGETLLDLATFLPDRAAFYLDHAYRLAGGIEPFLVRRPEGLAVPGVELLRLSCDFATGNAGVGAFFDRLWRGGPASFTLDEQLPVITRRDRREPA